MWRQGRRDRPVKTRRRRRSQRRGRTVRRVVRRFELWPVAKISFLFHLACFGLTFGVLTVVWHVARRSGLLDDLAKFLGDLGVVDDAKKDVKFHGAPIARGAAIIGATLVVINTIASVLLAFFYNLLSGIFGGLVISFLEDRPTRRRQAPAPTAGTPDATTVGPVDAVDSVGSPSVDLPSVDLPSVELDRTAPLFVPVSPEATVTPPSRREWTESGEVRAVDAESAEVIGAGWGPGFEAEGTSPASTESALPADR